MIKSEFLVTKLADLSHITPVFVTDTGYILGWWDDCGGYQFIVQPSSCGDKCSIITLGGSDYGGGVCDIFYDVDHSKVVALISGAESWGYAQCKLLNDILNDE